MFDIEIDAKTVAEMVAVVRALAPTFGGINLEDIKAPECFEVERILKEELDIPVFHDDQHGTAIISGAALLNAVKITGKKLEDMRVVVSGAGASAIACSDFYVKLGIQQENILLVDTTGVIYAGREENMKRLTSCVTPPIPTPARLADLPIWRQPMSFSGLSGPGVLDADLLVASMAEDPLIFALANPTPEIMPEEALAVRKDAIIATGRGDYPNMVNNVLGFPFIFRGALDVYARQINEEMKMAAAQALANLTMEDVPDSVLTAYGLSSLRFGRDYLIPKPLDPRVLLWVAPAIAKAAMDSGVARRRIDLAAYREELISRQGIGQQTRSRIIGKAKVGAIQRVLYAEGDESKVIRAATQVRDEDLAEPILIGHADRIAETIKALDLDFQPKIVDPYVDDLRDKYVPSLHEIRQRKGVTTAKARSMLRDRNLLGSMMLAAGEADAFISGLTFEYPDVVRPALQVFHTRPGVTCASGVYIVIVKKQVYLFTDATVNIDPDSATLAEIAISAADFARRLDIEPKVAMLSFSNFGSTPHPLSEKVRSAVEQVRNRRPDIAIDGEMQADTAVVVDLIESRYPFSRVKDANVLVFPDLGSANVAYKLLSRLGGAETIGPILLGIGAPVHVLQAGDDVEDIVAMTAVAVMDAQSRGYGPQERL